MCTAVTYCGKDHYFGRNLDLDVSLQETVTITPRNFPLRFRRVPDMAKHQAMIGMGIVAEGEPLYYDATNEAGLSMAGLNFPGFAVYQECREGMDNVTPYEFIPWILGQCETVEQALGLLERICLVKIPFNDRLPLAPLHWMIADRERVIVAEPREQGLQICEDPAQVLTNNPPFDYHLLHLTDYMGLTAEGPENNFAEKIRLMPYSLGMGAMGLPGDLSSTSRFVKGTFVRFHSCPGETEEESVSQFFHILGSVEVPRGCVRTKEDRFERTVYSSCCNTDRGIYYYTTYDNRRITAVDLHREDLEGSKVAAYPLKWKQDICYQEQGDPGTDVRDGLSYY